MLVFLEDMLKQRFSLLPQTLLVCLLLLLPRTVLAAAYSLPADIGSGPFSSCSGAGPAYGCSGNVRLGNNDSVTLTADVTLNMDRDFDVGKNVVIDNNGFLLGFDVSGDINIDDGARINAGLDAGGNIDVGKNVIINGNMTAGGDIAIGDDSSISGDIDSAGKVDIKKKVTISGNLAAIEDVKIGDDADITGNISSNGKIEINKNAVIVGDLVAVGDIKLGDDANITGDITSAGKIDISKRAVITGDLNAGDDVKIEQDIVINGDITTTGNLDIDNSSVVNGTCVPFHPRCNGGPPGAGCETFRDEFTNAVYSNQDGTLNWTAAWSEVADDGLPGSGSIRINANALRLDGGLQPVTVLGGRYIEREADLSGFANATLTFNYRETGGWEANDSVEVHVSGDGGVSWNLVQTFTDDQGATYQPFSADISAYIGANTRIAFVNKANNAGERFFIDNVQIEICTPTPLIDHFRITPATTAASTCLPNAITIVAEDASNNPVSNYTGTVNISTSTNHGNWSVNDADNVTTPNPDTDDNGAVSYSYLLSDAGEIVLDLFNTRAEVLTVSVTDAVEAVTSSSVAIAFSDNVFIIVEDPVQVAGRPQAMRIEMWTNDGGNCFNDTSYNYSPQTLDASIDRAGVLPGAIDPGIGGVSIPDGPGSAGISLDFSVTPGQANFNLDSTDVGQYRLTIVDNTNVHSAGVIVGTSNLLTVRPFGIAVTAITAPGPTLNPGGSAPTDPVFTVAGGDFSATVAGVLWDALDDSNNDGVISAPEAGVYFDNAVAPSYAWDTTLAVSPAAGSFTPDPGAPGVLNNGTILQGEFSAGSFNVIDLQYTEVGSFTLQSSAVNYLGSGIDIAGDDIVIGRFIPAAFDVTIPAAPNGQFDDTCGAITYIGQDFTYSTAPTVTINAQNALGATTLQYRDGFSKLHASSLNVDASQDDTTTDQDGNPMLVSYSASPMSLVRNNGSVDYSFGADVYRYGPDLPLTTFSKFDRTRVPPFPADINPEIQSVTDGEVTTVFAAATHLLDPAGNNLVFGRLRMNNVHGSELSALTMPVYTEYWSGVGWSKSNTDTCTSIADPNLVSVAVPVGLSTPTVFNTPFASAGNVDYVYPSPGAGNVGHIDTTTDLDSASHLWLRYDWDSDGVYDNDPAARATFGIFDGDPVQIYIQQIYAQ
jgi:predicted acyltransferase (DUF342 family)